MTAEEGAGFTPPPVPVRLAHMPLLGGLVIPVISARHRGGQAAFGVNHPVNLPMCLLQRRCGVCGEPLGRKAVFLMRPADLWRNSTVEPGMHPECANYVTRACPMVSGHMTRYRRHRSPRAYRCGDPACGCILWKPPGGYDSPRQGRDADPWYTLWTTVYETRYNQGRLVAAFPYQHILAIRPVGTAPEPEPGSGPDIANVLMQLKAVLDMSPDAQD